MRLTLAIHPIEELRFGEATRLDGTTLAIDQEELRRLLLADGGLESVDLEVVRPGERCRFGAVFEVVEPRAKEPADGADFPGILGPLRLAGRGTTHVLRGAAVSVIQDGSAFGRVIEMSGAAGEASPYSRLHHLVVVPHPRASLPRRALMRALRVASLKAAVYLAKAALGQEASTYEVYECGGPAESATPGVPRLAYIGQIHSFQMVAEPDEPIFYGSNTIGMAPAALHPNEWLDGAIVSSYFNLGVETYFYQNHPIINELYRWQEEGKVLLTGTVATMAASDNRDRERNSMIAAALAKWNLAADAVVLTKYGGGAPHADMGLTARYCEELGIRTVVQVSDMSTDRSAESALLFNYPEVDAIVNVGRGDTLQWVAPEVERVIAASAGAAASLASLERLTAGSVCGVTGQQGLSRLRSFVY